MKKLRLFFILCGLGFLALISTIFGMMMAVASDLPALENTAEYNAARNSVLLAGDGTELARLTGNQNRILIDESEVAPALKNAVIAVEDQRFYEHSGVDYLGIGRALVQDLRRQTALQGGSTITQQFVKNALAAQGDRSVFQKLREAALAFHLERQWTKQKILTQYLNTVYFGNGAYGVESAMRTYFGGGAAPPADGTRLSRVVQPAQAALLAAMIASPSAYDPVQNPDAARSRRDLVLGKMFEQGFIDQQQYQTALRVQVPTADDIEPPAIDSEEPYFTTWVTQQVVDRYGAGTVFGGGLTIKTTLDRELQDAAGEAVSSNLDGIGPTAAVVAIDNGTGEVRAMVGGDDFADQPFNLATNGHRQPGSAIKPFTLVAALEQGVSPEDTFVSEPKTLKDPASPAGFKVRNYEGEYSGTTTLRSAIAQSDNSVFAELGTDVVGTKRIAALANRMGIRTPLSTNPAMTLGGLEEGVTPLEMAFAYATIANRGVRRSGSLASSPLGPVGLLEVSEPSDDPDKPVGRPIDTDAPRESRVFPSATGETAIELLRGVVSEGTGSAAQIDETAWGKTGTTENYGDAWFCGGSDEVDITACVWVGYPDGQQSMKTEFGGQPVAGGTYPAQIWRDFMAVVLDLHAQKVADRDARDGVVTEPVPTEPAPAAPPAETVTEEPKTEKPVEEQPPAEEPPAEEPPADQTPPEGGQGTPSDFPQ